MAKEYVAPEDGLEEKIYNIEKKQEEEKHKNISYILSQKTAMNFDDN